MKNLIRLCALACVFLSACSTPPKQTFTRPEAEILVEKQRLLQMFESKEIALKMYAQLKPLFADIQELTDEQKKSSAYKGPKPLGQRKAADYPADLFKAGQQAVVWIVMALDKEGRVERAHWIVDGDARFGEITEKEARSWRFKPATLNGEPVGVRIAMPVLYLVM